MNKGIEQAHHDFDSSETPEDSFSGKQFESMDVSKIPEGKRKEAQQHLEDKANGREAMLRYANVNPDNTLKPKEEDVEVESMREARDQMDQSLDSIGLSEYKEAEDPQKSLDRAMEATRQYEVQLEQLGREGGSSSSADAKDFEKGPDQAAQ